MDTLAFVWQEESRQILTTELNKNLLVIAPTGGGKTVAAAQAFAHYGRGILVEPTRALCFEKKHELEQMLSHEGLTVRIGNKDYGLGPKSFTKDDAADISVISPFKLGQLLTNLGRKLADYCPVVCFDEAHQFAELEGSMTLLKILCPTVRVVVLSATIPDDDVNGLSHWLKARVIQSDVRPVPLVQKVVSFEPDFGDDDETSTNMRIIEVGGDEQVEYLKGDLDIRKYEHVMAINRHIVRDNSLRAPVLIWTPYRERANQIAELLLAERQQQRNAQPDPRLEQAVAQLPDNGSEVTDLLKRCVPWGIGVHHGGLSQFEAEMMYNIASDNKFLTMVGCRTLAQGLNLPWRHVVIEDSYDHDNAGERRLISPSFFHQLSGRAGRPSKDTIGYVWIPAHTAIDRVQIEEVLLKTKASPLVSRLGDERSLTILLPQLVKLQFDTINELVGFVQSSYWGTILTDTTSLFDQLQKIIRFLIEKEVMFPLGDLLVLTERGNKLASLGLHPYEFEVIERLAAERSLDYTRWIEELGYACLGAESTDADRQSLSAVAEYGLTIYSATGKTNAKARDLADRIQRLLEITTAYFSHKCENVPINYRKAWTEQVQERFALGNLELARQLKTYTTWSQLKRLIRNLGGLMKGEMPLNEQHHAIIAASLYGDEPVFRFGADAKSIGTILGVKPEEWLSIIIAERGKR